jgi:hypothetical protein
MKKGFYSIPLRRLEGFLYEATKNVKLFSKSKTKIKQFETYSG